MNNDLNSKGSLTSDKNAWLTRERALALFFITLTVITAYVCYLIGLPFIASVTWAAALAVVTNPLYNRILSRTDRPNVSAGITVFVMAIVILTPAVFLGQTLVSQVAKSAQTLKTQTSAELWKQTVESNPKLTPIISSIEQYFDLRAAGERVADAATSQITNFIGGSIWVVAQIAFTFFALFYFYRDRLLILKTIKSLLPLSQSETDKLFFQIENTIYTTFYGTFMVSLAQGILGGLLFWVLGIPAPLLWGTAMFLLSLIPVLGAPIVWIPVSIYLALNGDWGKALGLAGWGFFVIGTVDNLLYPILVGDRIRMHPLVVFFSVVGGLALFGSAGLVLGPVVVVVMTALIEFWRERTLKVKEDEGS